MGFASGWDKMFCAAWRVARVMLEKDCKSARRAWDAFCVVETEGG